MTANALEDEAQNALKLGFKNYLTKPLNIEVFLKTVDKLLLWFFTYLKTKSI